MADPDIPPELLDVARAHLAAVARTKAAAASGEPLDEPMAAERQAVADVYAARAGTPFEAWSEWKRVVEAAQAE